MLRCVWEWLSFLGGVRRKNNSARVLTVGKYLKQHPEVRTFWLQTGQTICRYDIKKDPNGWKTHRNDRILRIEHLDGEPVVLHVEPFGKGGR